MSLLLTLLVRGGPPTTVDSGYHSPNDTGAVLLWVGAILLLLLIVAVAAAIANHRDARREERGEAERSDSLPPGSG